MRGESGQWGTTARSLPRDGLPAQQCVIGTVVKGTPTPSGSVIVGSKAVGLDEVKNNQPCIVLSRTEGIVYKRVVRNNKVKNKITLVSDNPSFQPYQVNSEDILEIWQAQVVISKVSQQQLWDVNQLATLVSSLQEQVSTLKKRYN